MYMVQQKIGKVTIQESKTMLEKIKLPLEDR